MIFDKNYVIMQMVQVHIKVYAHNMVARLHKPPYMVACRFHRPVGNFYFQEACTDLWSDTMKEQSTPQLCKENQRNHG